MKKVCLLIVFIFSIHFVGFGQTAEEYFKLGEEKFDRENYNSAISYYNSSINLNSNNYKAYNSRGNAKYMLNDYQGAYDDYSKAVKLNPNDKIPQDNRKLAKSMIDKYEKQSKSAEMYFEKGNQKYDNEDFNSAISNYDSSIKLNPDNYKVYNSRGNAKYMISDFQGAYNDYDKAVKLNPLDKVPQDNRKLAQSMIDKPNTDQTKISKNESRTNQEYQAERKSNNVQRFRDSYSKPQFVIKAEESWLIKQQAAGINVAFDENPPTLQFYEDYFKQIGILTNLGYWKSKNDFTAFGKYVTETLHNSKYVNAESDYPSQYRGIGIMNQAEIKRWEDAVEMNKDSEIPWLAPPRPIEQYEEWVVGTY